MPRSTPTPAPLLASLTTPNAHGVTVGAVLAVPGGDCLLDVAVNADGTAALSNGHADDIETFCPAGEWWHEMTVAHAASEAVPA
ncbi:hypothetical protein GCM10022288_26520 [Gryllotalpicola kribbensis]|uniref:Uncharacterized protein n=1 Tax=Gryllotalpicola kribbensis TaxID=993084 RepID=A0ABP8AYA8_9MICO